MPSGTYEVCVDPRTELLYSALSVTGWGQRALTRTRLAYKDEILELAGRKLEHPAVLLASRLASGDFIFDAPFGFILHHGRPPQLRRLVPYPSSLTTRAGWAISPRSAGPPNPSSLRSMRLQGQRILETFASHLRGFCKEIGFIGFFREHGGFYEGMVDSIEERLEGERICRFLEDYFGDSLDGYALILCPLVKGGISFRVATHRRGGTAYAALGPSGSRRGKPVFDTRIGLEIMLVHELAHQFVNPVVEANMARVEETSRLFKPIIGTILKRAGEYTAWWVVVCEHLIRAMTYRYLVQTYGQRKAERNLRSQLWQGFAYIDHFVSLLERYEKQRVRYPTLSSFFPTVADSLRGLATGFPTAQH